MGELSGRVAVVTGGTRGIGRCIAEHILRAGGEVLVCGRREVQEPPRADARVAQVLTADVRRPEQAQELIETAVERFGRLDLLVNNAGGSPPVLASEASPRFVRAIIDLNLVAPLVLSQAAHRVMVEQEKGGVIVQIASVSGTRPSPGTSAYGAAKAGLLHATRSLAVEWAPKVRVVAITPGMVRTRAAVEYYGGEEGLARVASTVPMGRLVREADVAQAVLFLASPRAASITGSHLVIDGGGETPAALRVLQQAAAAEDAT